MRACPVTTSLRLQGHGLRPRQPGLGQARQPTAHPEQAARGSSDRWTNWPQERDAGGQARAGGGSPARDLCALGARSRAAAARPVSPAPRRRQLAAVTPPGCRRPCVHRCGRSVLVAGRDRVTAQDHSSRARPGGHVATRWHQRHPCPALSPETTGTYQKDGSSAEQAGGDRLRPCLRFTASLSSGGGGRHGSRPDAGRNTGAACIRPGCYSGMPIHSQEAALTPGAILSV